MKLIKGIFPSAKKTVGFIVMAALGVMIWNVTNSKFGIEQKVSEAIPGGEQV